MQHGFSIFIVFALLSVLLISTLPSTAAVSTSGSANSKWQTMSWGPTIHTLLHFNQNGSGVDIIDATKYYETWTDFGIVSTTKYPLSGNIEFNASMLSGQNRYVANFYISPTFSNNTDPYRGMANWVGFIVTGNYEFGSWYAQVARNVSGVGESRLYNQQYTGTFPLHWRIDFLSRNWIRVYINDQLVFSTDSLGLKFNSGYLYFFESTNLNGYTYELHYHFIQL